MRNQKGFSMVAALALAAVLGIGAMFLGQVLSYLKTKKLQAQARVSAIGYEDSLIAELIPRVWTRLNNAHCVVDVATFITSIGPVNIPGTAVGLNIKEVVPNDGLDSISGNTTTLIMGVDINGGVAAQAGQPKPPDQGPQFINNPADISFRLDFISAATGQERKMFGPFTSCRDFRALSPEERQIKVSYGINWNYRGKEMNLSGSKFVNLQELGL